MLDFSIFINTLSLHQNVGHLVFIHLIFIIYNQIQVLREIPLMNPFLASLIFIAIFYFLSQIKQSLFPSNSQIKIDELHQVNFHKILQLTPNHKSFHDNQQTTFNSLYEAYHSKSVSASQFNYSIPQNFTNFNYSVLQESIQTQKNQFLCGNDFMLLVWRGMRSNKSGNAEWINFIELYRLPLLEKLDTLTLFGRTRVPKLCKKHKVAGRYQFGLVNENRPTLITFNSTGKLSLHTNLLEYLDEYSLEILIFDYTTNFWAYTSREQPWIVKIAQKSFESKQNQPNWVMKKQKNNINGQSGLYQTNTFLQIDMIDIERSRMNRFLANQILNINHLFIKYLNNHIYLTCIYEYFSTEEKLKKVIQASFKIQSETLSLLSHFDMYVGEPNGEQLMTQCHLFSSFQNKNTQEKEIINLSCLIYKKSEPWINFVEADDVYNIKKKHRKKIKATQAHPNHFYDDDYWGENSYTNIYEETEDDLLFMLKKMTPIAKKEREQPIFFQEKPIVHRYILTTQVTFQQIRLIKPSLPDPIIFISDSRQYFLQAYKVPINVVQNQIIKINNILYSLTPDTLQFNEFSEFSEKQDYQLKMFYHQYIKLIQYVEEPAQEFSDNNRSRDESSSNGRLGEKKMNHMIMVIWGNRIEVYQYMKVLEFRSNIEEEGVSMAIVLPFIELFATVFCMFQTVWGASS